mmetsp:Transcript_5475/g.11533  ORF Transcript_5475/g.11533 Transcript_5475/m.11533 type:complete len:320 (-) Transcript_5475:339-1298(-)
MSSAAMGDDAEERCASCGITGGDDDDIKLKNCTACKLVKYCGVECQRNHRPQHKRACKKRAAELKDELLFKQPESTNFGDCPICFLPMRITAQQDELTIFKKSCCSKVVCNGCEYANTLREKAERLPMTCPFCRHPVMKNEAECHLHTMKRVEANDPFACYQAGMRRFYASDYATAIEYFDKAIELGDIESHHLLSIVYKNGHGVQRDIKKVTYHLEKAAIGGHPIARHNLGWGEHDKGNIDRAVKHFIIAAKLGIDESMQVLKTLYTKRVVSKEDFAATLRAYQEAVDAMKSPQRDAAESAENNIWDADIIRDSDISV